MHYSSRREFIKNAGVATLGLITVSGLAGVAMSCAKPSLAANQQPSSSTPVTSQAPWPYQKIDPVTAAERAYAAYYNGGCMYGAFEGIIGELREKIGAPYDTFPTAMMKYGGAGVAGWGTLCGCLNGISAAIYLLKEPADGGLLVSEVFGWYSTTSLPDYKPASPKFPEIATSISDSPLCHVSVTTWCNEAGYKALSPERAERCAWLTASTAKYTADLLNQQADGVFKASFALPESVTGCLSCHGKGGAFENVHMSKVSSCSECHSDGDMIDHPAILK